MIGDGVVVGGCRLFYCAWRWLISFAGVRLSSIPRGDQISLSVTDNGAKSSSLKMSLLNGNIPVHRNKARIFVGGNTVLVILGISYIVIVFPRLFLIQLSQAKLMAILNGPYTARCNGCSL